MGLPGSLTLRPEVFCGIVEDYVSCYVRHGFKKIVLGSSHGGNFAVLDKLAQELDEKYPDTRIVSALSLADFTDTCSSADEMFGLEKGACGAHACCFETSIMLHIAPELVNMDKVVRGYMSTDTAEGAKKLLEGGVKALTPTGILGDPTVASAEKGKAYFDMLVKRTLQAIEMKLK
jgi:creatinine amidohydrolase